jgi:hypothetical protein
VAFEMAFATATGTGSERCCFQPTYIRATALA